MTCGLMLQHDSFGVIPFIWDERVAHMPDPTGSGYGSEGP